MVWYYLQKIQNQLKAKTSIMSSGGLLKRRILSRTFINVNWEILHASILCKPNMFSQKCVWMDIPTCCNWFNEEELVIQLFCLWKIIQGILQHFKGRMLWGVILLPM